MHTERDNHKNCVFLLSAQFQLIFAFNEKKKQRTYSLNVWIVGRAMMFFDCRKVMRNLLSLVSRTVVNIVSIVFQYASSLMKMSNIFIAPKHL